MIKKLQDNPVLVEVHRGDQVESIHRGSVVAVNSAGEVVFSAGDVSKPVYPRSSLKMFQAIPLVESGAADHFNLTPAEISLACASHNAEKFHVSAVIQWLQRLGLKEEDLESGPALPVMELAAHELIASGKKPTRVHQNCSGKHAGMLTVARFMRADIRGYSDYAHPSQRAWMQTLSELVDLDVFSLPWQRDGCGLPAIVMPLDRIARAFACFADTGKVGGKRGVAMQRIVDSIRAYPQMIAGTDRCCTAVIAASNGRVVVKVGAEGVYGGAIADTGIGFALKIDDGAGRASEVALGALLSRLGVLDEAIEEKLAPHFRPPVVNSQGWKTGEILPSPYW